MTSCVCSAFCTLLLPTLFWGLRILRNISKKKKKKPNDVCVVRGEGNASDKGSLY